jgi:hypothetical protein
MPNWVFNIMHVNGPQEDLDNLMAHLKHTDKDGVEMPISYMSMRSPFESPYNITEEEYYTENGYANGARTGNTAGNWYNWNGMKWGVKWDASNPELDTSEPQQLRYSWESPWGTPDPQMFLELSEVFPNLEFSLWYEEEQGWGGEYEFSNGEYTDEKEWGIPESHADKMALDQTCFCEFYEDDFDNMYDDCPAKIEHEKSLTTV